MRRVVAALACALFVAGCATVTSVGDFSVPDTLKAASGYYHLPRTVLNVKVTPAGGTATAPTPATIAVTAAAESDPEASVLFNIEHNPLFDDVIEVKTDASGLLQSVASDSKDRTGDIAVNLAKIIFSSQTGGDVPNVRSLPASGTAIGPGFAASYDPFDVKQAHLVKQALVMAGFCILVGEEVRGAGARGLDAACRSPPPRQPTELIAASYAGRNPGIYYRRPTPMPIQIYQKGIDPKQPDAFKSIWAGNELFFDKTALYRVDLDRAAFVQKKVTLTFASGALGAVKVEHPSEILGVTNSLVQVAQIVFSIPLAGFKQDKALVDAQTDLLKSQASYIQAQQSLLKLQQQSTDGRTLVFTPDYSTGGRNLQTSDGGLLSDVDRCVRDFGRPRDECVGLINKDAQSTQ